MSKHNSWAIGSLFFLLPFTFLGCKTGSGEVGDGDSASSESEGGDGDFAGGDGDGSGAGDGFGASSGDGDAGSSGGTGATGSTGTGGIGPDPVDIPIVEGTPGADFYPPAPIVDLLRYGREVSWGRLQRPAADLVRFSWSVSGSDDFFIATDDGRTVDAPLGLSPGLGSADVATDDVLLRSMFQLIQARNGVYRIASAKHPNFSLDVDDAGSVILRDVRSMERDDGAAGYLGFVINGSGPFTLQAVGRWVVQSGAIFSEEGGFASRSLTVSDGKLSLGAEGATPLELYNPPINFDIPYDFNPDGVERFPNAEVTPFSKGADKQAAFAGKVIDRYAAQVAAPGLNDQTAAAAEVALQEIEQSLLSEVATMRYPAAFYLALREGFLSRICLSSEATDASLGQHAVPYVLFTNGVDNEGVHHPFMVIATRGLPDSQALLWDVPHPPGGDPSLPYAEQPVTRSYHQENFVIKIPLRDYGQVTSLTENDMVRDLASDRSGPYNHHSYASISAVGVAIDGVVIYPTFNAGLHISAGVGELSAHGHHAGQGLGTHYHADSHSAEGRGLNLYNASDYLGRHHPPIISAGFDGIAGYGVYPVGDTSLDGATVPLDEFGGHEHDEYGYHYHSSAVPAVSEKQGNAYIAHQLPPLGAWAGRINSIPDFWDGVHPDYSGKGSPRYLGTGTN